VRFAPYDVRHRCAKISEGGASSMGRGRSLGCLAFDSGEAVGGFWCAGVIRALRVRKRLRRASKAAGRPTRLSARDRRRQSLRCPRCNSDRRVRCPGPPRLPSATCPSQRAVPRALRGPARLRRRRGSPVHLLLRGALSSKKRVPTTPSAGLGLMQLVETLTLSRTKTQVNPPAAVPDIAKAHA
jgi:hypothetical protein